jgi:hypothetical protein
MKKCRVKQPGPNVVIQCLHSKRTLWYTSTQSRKCPILLQFPHLPPDKSSRSMDSHWSRLTQLYIFSITMDNDLNLGQAHFFLEIMIIEYTSFVYSPNHLPKWFSVIFLEMQISSAYKILKYSFSFILLVCKIFSRINKARTLGLYHFHLSNLIFHYNAFKHWLSLSLSLSLSLTLSLSLSLSEYLPTHFYLLAIITYTLD